MAAYEDFEFFRTGTTAVRPAPRAPSARSARDGMRIELERLHAEVTRLRSHLARRSWQTRVRLFLETALSRRRRAGAPSER